MCGIVGLFLKDKALEPQLGALLSEMLITMTDRGPDCAGIAIYGAGRKGHGKITIQSRSRMSISTASLKRLAKLGVEVKVAVKSTHAVVEVPAGRLDAAARPSLNCARMSGS